MIVGLTGYAGAGKDTAAQALLDLGWERRAFADPMRRGLLGVDPLVVVTSEQRVALMATISEVIVAAPLPITVRLSWLIDNFGWDASKRIVPEVRRLQQTYGTEGGRDIHGQSCWTSAAELTMEPGVHYVFTDCRFDNEAVFIQERGGVVVELHRDGVGPANSHASEHLPPADFCIGNNGSVPELHQALIEGLSDWFERAYTALTPLGEAMLAAAERNGEVPSAYLLRTTQGAEVHGPEVLKPPGELLDRFREQYEDADYHGIGGPK